MKISINWLKDYVTFKATPKELAHKLTMAGLEVEKVSRVGKEDVFELEITPNRPDCLNMIGIAREISAIYNKKLDVPKFKEFKKTKEKVDIQIEDKQGCAQYIGTILKDVKVKEAPTWMKMRLKALGLRPVNNIVDVTNFCLLETGQPMHAFDYDKLVGGKIIVRRAKKGEKIVTIDDVERELDPSMLVIADAKRPVAIAGVMGGKETEVTTATKNILLESAYFDPILIRRASRKIALSTDSSYRFERGVDFDMVTKGSNRALGFLLECCGGTITAATKALGTRKNLVRKKILLSIEKSNFSLGAKIPSSKYKDILEKLGFKIRKKTKDVLEVTPPPFRGDIKQAVDLVEEVARVMGYDNLPMSVPHIKMSNIPTDVRRQSRKKIRDLLCALGYSETITYTMTNQEALKKVGQQELKGVGIQNPLTQDQEMMRPSLLPLMMNVVKTNINRGEKRLKLFETGKTYATKDEKEVLGIVLTGPLGEDWRQLKKQKADYYDIKGVVEKVLAFGGLGKSLFEKVDLPFLQSAESAAVVWKGKTIGFIGKITDEVLSANEIKNAEVYFAQISLEAIFAIEQKIRKYCPVSEYPSIVRDVSIAIKKETPYQEVKKTVVSSATKLLKEISFKEEYLGEKLPQGTRGLIFSLTYQSKDRTLTEEEVNQIHSHVCQKLVDEFEAIIR